jgi:hypothetical protein
VGHCDLRAVSRAADHGAAGSGIRDLTPQGNLRQIKDSLAIRLNSVSRSDGQIPANVYRIGKL